MYIVLYYMQVVSHSTWRHCYYQELFLMAHYINAGPIIYLTMLTLVVSSLKKCCVTKQPIIMFKLLWYIMQCYETYPTPSWSFPVNCDAGWCWVILRANSASLYQPSPPPPQSLNTALEKLTAEEETYNALMDTETVCHRTHTHCLPLYTHTHRKS